MTSPSVNTQNISMGDSSQKTAGSLPSVRELFILSWKNFKQTVLSLLLLLITSFAFYVGLVIAVGILIAILIGATGMYKFFTPDDFPRLFTAAPISILLITLIILVGILVVLIFGAMMQIATILVVAHPGEKLDLVATFRKSWGMVGTFLVANFITSFISIGGLFFFLIPAVFFYILFQFVSYEVIVNNQKAYPAIRRSVYLVKARFGEVVVRVSILVLIYILLVSVVPVVLKMVFAPWIVQVLSFVVNTLFGWFSLCYSVALYNEVRSSLAENEFSMKWVWVVSLLGWLVFILFIIIGAGLGMQEILKYYNNNGGFSPPPKSVQPLNTI